MFTDGENNLTDADFELYAQFLGHGSPSIVTPDGLALPDHLGVYHQLKANQPPWYGARMVSNGDGTYKAYSNDAPGSTAPLPIAPSFYAAPEMRNEIVQSRDLSNTAWQQSGTDVAAYDAVGLDGAISATTLTDDDGGASENVTEAISGLADDNATHTLRLFVDKDTDETRFPEVDFRVLGTTSLYNRVQINTKTGDMVVRAAVGVTDQQITDLGGRWEWLISVANDSTGNTSSQITISPARSTVIGVINNAATGSIIVSNVELHLNKTIDQVRGSAPIFTAGAAVTQAAIQLPYSILNASDDQGLYWCEVNYLGYGDDVAQGLITNGSAVGQMYTHSVAMRMAGYDGVNVNIVGDSPAINVWHKSAITYSAAESLYQAARDGDTNEVPYDGAFDAGATLRLLEDVQVATLIRNVRRYDLAYAQANAKRDELMTEDPLNDIDLGVGWTKIGYNTYQFDVPPGVNFVAATFSNVIVGNNYNIKFTATGDLPVTALVFRPGDFSEDTLITEGSYDIDFLADNLNGTTRFAVQDITDVTQFRIGNIQVTAL